jgi:hypothetical protein
MDELALLMVATYIMIGNHAEKHLKNEGEI